jgi:hypothetical protein
VSISMSMCEMEIDRIQMKVDDSHLLPLRWLLYIHSPSLPVLDMRFAWRLIVVVGVSPF